MITVTLAPCQSVSAPFAAGAKEQVALVGQDLPAGTQIGLFDGAGTCLAVADVKDGEATLDLDTQEAMDALSGVAIGETATVWAIVGDKDTHIATIRARLLLNYLDTSAHPPAPLPAYWTAEQTQAAIAEAVRGLASEKDVDGKIAAHNAAADAHEDIREKLADKAEISELVTETEAREQGDADTLASAKAYADGKVAGAYRYKGTVATVDDLPASGNAEGDVWARAWT